jgi:hypothetical protein
MSRASKLAAGALAGALAWACAKHPGRRGDDEALASPEGRVWAMTCPGGDPEVAWLWLEPGGSLHTAYPDPGDWRRDPGDTWTFDGSRRTMTLAWAGGYASVALRWSGAPALRGSSSRRACPSTVALELADDVPAPSEGSSAGGGAAAVSE